MDNKVFMKKEQYAHFNSEFQKYEGLLNCIITFNNKKEETNYNQKTIFSFINTIFNRYENFVFSEQTLDLLRDRIKNNLKECFIKYRVTLEENKIEELTDTLTNEFFYMKFICPAVNLKEVFSQSLSRMTFDQLKKEINPAIKNLKIETILK